jgi:hypothetical protein
MFPEGTVRVKLPSEPVVVALVPPFTLTVVAATPWLSGPVTFPVSCLVWASAHAPTKNTRQAVKNDFFMLVVFRLMRFKEKSFINILNK